MRIEIIAAKLPYEELIDKIAIWKADGVSLVMVNKFSNIGRNMKEVISIYQELRKGEPKMDMYFVDINYYFTDIAKNMKVGTSMDDKNRENRLLAYVSYLARR